MTVLISEIAMENNTNKAITMPVLGALLSMRDKNIMATMNGLSLLNYNQLDNIKRLAH